MTNQLFDQDSPFFRDHQHVGKDPVRDAGKTRTPGRAWEQELREKLGRMTRVRAVRGVAFKNCCLRTGRYDGSLRKYYFRE